MTREEIIQYVPIREVLERYGVKVDRHGKCCCPLPTHSEKTPSFKVYEDRHRFYCFGCHETGTVIDLVMKMENCDFKTAFHSLGGTCNNTTDKKTAERIQRERTRKKKERELVEAKEEHFKSSVAHYISYCRAAISTLEPFSEEWCFFQDKLQYLLHIWEEHYVNGREVNEPNVYRVCREIGRYYDSR